ncbi:Oidioi.mRNA.OKI2018_I69.PAR.g12832.t1.cds [Oikopleura dioica]|uniref:Oidioi.mRNA.OKI2018_I69.PAR.g12832.t1.cds n=1 Tax=Oikopleura dioica TaxID=34765 RepID=A0ABN7S831_OIKDI|nr:Oidioi.mRNA.OKI2018_I69.PAR.g12832.t1.cds [Oikopleura dioica]
MKISTTILAGVSASPFLADSQEANAFLNRTRRAWQFFEETKDGNWERECIEEYCNANEAFEVVDEEVRGKRLFDLVTECKKKYPATANQRKCVENGLQPSWGEWGEWSASFATCINPVTGSMRINSEVFANYIGQSKQFSYYDTAPASLRSRSKITIDENGRWAELRIKQMTPQDEGMMISIEIHYEGYFDEQAVVVPSSRPDY